LGKSTLGKYEFALEMLQACLDNYGHQLLDDDEEEMLVSYQEGDESGEEFSFCCLFGSEKIPGMINEFLGYFMVHKVVDTLLPVRRRNWRQRQLEQSGICRLRTS